MPPHSQNLEVSVRQLKHSNITNSYFQADSSSNLNVNSSLLNESPSNSYEYIVGEIEGFISNDLNRSIGEDTNGSSNSMDEIIQNGSANPFDELLSSIDTNHVKNESYDTEFNMYIDPNVEYQPFYSQQIQSNTMNYTDNQMYSNSIMGTSNEPNNMNQPDHLYKPSLPCTSNILDINSIKQEVIQNEDHSESSYCSSNETYPNPPQTMTPATYKSMSKQSRASYEKRYGPIVVRPRKNPAPTLASGRKSKYTVLAADEERKREIRRSRNRQAAEKCKQKRSEIEEQLEYRMKILENEKHEISSAQAQLLETKHQLEHYLNQHIEKCTNSTTSTYSNQNIYSLPQQVAETNININYNLINNSNNMSILQNTSNNTQQYGNYMQLPYSEQQQQMNMSYIEPRHAMQQQSKNMNIQQTSYNY